MRLHSLTLQAIGPYAGEHAIDFVELGRAGLFLLEGPTGAGKSTIIDAIVFGLYGELAGTGASKDRLHSHHAAPGVVPFVELVFETGSGVYRVRRTPAHRRLKQRGEGFTDQQASATLMRLTDPDALTGETLSTRAQEVGPEIARIVGLTRAQFVQTIVLPQGEFAKFLSADGEDRSALLRSLFGTEHYERLAEHLVGLRKEARREVEAAEQALGEAVARFSGAAQLTGADGDEAPEGAGAEPGAAVVAAVPEAAAEPGADSAGEVADVAELQDARLADAEVLGRSLTARSETLQPDVAAIVTVLRRHATEAEAAAAEASAVLDDSRRDRDAALQLAQRLERRLALLVQREQLAVDDDWIIELRAQLAAAQRAETTVTAISGLRSARVALDRAQDARVNALADAGPRTSLLTPAELEDRREAITGERSGMATLISRERSLPQRQSDLAALEERMLAAESRIAELETAETGRGIRRGELGDVVARLDAARAASAEATAALESARGTLAMVDRVEALDIRLGLAADAVEVAAVAARVAVDHEAALRRQRIDGIAGELAAGLRDDDACPVCGSVEHPALATLSGEHPSAATIEDASAARDRAEQAVQTARAAHGALAAERDVVFRELSGGAAAVGGAEAAGAVVAGVSADVIDPMAGEHTIADIRAAAVAGELTAAEQVDVATTELAAADRGMAEHRELEDASDAAAAERTALALSLATLTERRTSETEAIAATRADIDRALGDQGESLEELDGRLAAERERIMALAAAHAAVAERELRLAERETELSVALETAGFADVDEAVAATLDGGDRARHEATVADHTRHSQQVTDGLASAEIASLTGAEVADVEAAEERFVAAREAAAAAAAIAAVTGTRAAQAERAQAELDDAIAENATAVLEAAEVIRLADVVSATGSENTKRITLGTYVLLRRFEDVVAAANARLESMSGGRYELVRSDVKEGASRAQRIGLSLTVHDHRTDTRRDPKSLSGGETFYASLCLALGLADVVTGEAGGVELGTLFVDEGFGSLDPETLDTVMAELGRLSAGGRVVGVVSHVEEMKQRIGERIEVRRLEDGSSTLLVRA